MHSPDFEATAEAAAPIPADVSMMPKTSCSTLFEKYRASRKAYETAADEEAAALHVLHSIVPQPPPQLIFPDENIWIFIGGWTPSRRDFGQFRDGPRYYRVEALAEFIANPPPSASSNIHIAYGALQRAKELLPIAKAYQQQIDDARLRAGVEEKEEATESAAEAKFSAITALMEARAEHVRDFQLKAQMIREMLDEYLNMDDELESLVDQVLNWFSRKSIA